MSTKQNSISSFLRLLFGTGYYENEIELDPELRNALENVDNSPVKSKTEEPINTENKNSGKKNIKRKYETPEISIHGMTKEKLEEMTSILEKGNGNGKERGE